MRSNIKVMSEGSDLSFVQRGYVGEGNKEVEEIRAREKIESSRFEDEDISERQIICTPQKRQMVLDDNGYHRRLDSSDFASLESDVLDEDINAFDSSENFHDSGYSEFLDIDDGSDDVHSSTWSIQQHLSPVRCGPNTRQTRMVRWSSPMEESPRPRSPAPREGDDDTRLLDSFLPSVVRLGPVKRGDSREGRGAESVYGVLFEQPDPWRTIGLIIGLPREMESETLAQDFSVEMDVDEERVDEQHISHFSPQESMEAASGQWGDVGHLDDQLSGEVHHKLVRDDEGEHHDDISMAAAASKSVSPSGASHSIRVTSPGIPCSFESMSEGRQGIRLPYSAYSEIKKRLDEEVSAFLQDSDGDDEYPDLERGEIFLECNEEDVGSTRAQSAHPDPSPVPVETSVLIQPKGSVDAEDEEHSSLQGSPKIFEIPELQEVNGRFLGPSLFDVFQDSEEE